MNKIVLMAHCILNGCCELPEASDALRRQIVNILIDKGANIVQLPCPELCFQALDRHSINPGDSNAEEYANYCERLLLPILNNLLEYDKHNIEIMGVIGVDTSPSCSVTNSSAIMMKVLKNNLEENKVSLKNSIDMPIGDIDENNKFILELAKW